MSKTTTDSKDDRAHEQSEDLARVSEKAERERKLDQLVRLTEELGGYEAEEEQ